MSTADALAAHIQRQVDDLPVLPTTVVRMLSLDRRSDRWFEDLVDLVRREPTYAARVLAAANAASRRGRTEITTIREAVLRLGASPTSQLVVSLSVVRVFVPTNAWERSLWTHAITVATLARALAEGTDLGPYRPDDAYLCGLLHDLGRFILFQEAPEALRQIEEAPWSNPADLVSAEIRICGVDHAALGARAVEHWGLPSVVVQVVRRHHQRQTENDPLSRLVAVVQAADRLDFFEVSPGHQAGEARPPDTDADLLARVAAVLPRGYRQAPAVVLPRIRAALDEAHQALEALFP